MTTVWLRAFRDRPTGDPGAQAFSVRPDLWGPGLFARSGEGRPDQVYATWGGKYYVADLVVTALAAGRGAPGVAEADILAGGLRVTAHPDQAATWVRLEGP